MKSFILSSMFLIFGMSIAQKNISTTRIGDIRLSFDKFNVEKTLGRKINLVKNEYNYQATAVHYDAKIDLNFYAEENDGYTKYVLESISTQSTQIKTLSGFGVGSTLKDLLLNYRTFNLELYSDSNNKAVQYLSIMDYDNSTQLIFELVNQVVVKITLSHMDEGC